MTAESFVLAFKEQMPNKKAYDSLGVSDAYITRELAMYEIKSRNKKSSYDDSLLNLIAEYDVSNVEIGMVTFNSELKEDSSYYHIGKIEADLIVKNKRTGAIQVLEFDQPSHVLYDVATNGSFFLDALLLCNSHINKGLFDDGYREDENMRVAVIEQCAKISGGAQYMDFYEMLIG